MAEPFPNHNPQKSFKVALQANSDSLLTILPSNPELCPKSEHLGEPACIYSDDQIAILSAHYSNALVGKFTKGRFTMAQLEQSLRTVGLTGKFQIGSLDYKHVLIRFELINDYQRVWMKGIWNFNGVFLKMLKWTPYFSTHRESPIVPVWCTIREVPLYYYNTASIEAIGNTIGSFIKNDLATEKLTRPSAIKLCVEVNLQKPLCGFIRLGSISKNWKYDIEYEDVPLYCDHCAKLGHSQDQCRVLKSTPAANNNLMSLSKNGPQWKPTGVNLSKEPDAVPLTNAGNPVLSLAVTNLNLNTEPYGPLETKRVSDTEPLQSPILIPEQSPITTSQEISESSLSNLQNEIAHFSGPKVFYSKDDLLIGISGTRSSPTERQLFLQRMENRFSLLEDIESIDDPTEMEDQDRVDECVVHEHMVDIQVINPQEKAILPGKSNGKDINYSSQPNKMRLRSAAKKAVNIDAGTFC